MKSRHRRCRRVVVWIRREQREKGEESLMIRIRALRFRMLLVAIVTAIAVQPVAFAQEVDIVNRAAWIDSPAELPAQADAAWSGSSGSPEADDFYVRAAIVLDWSETTRFKDEDCLRTAPAALYGCGNGIDGAPLSSLGDFGMIAGFDFGIGYVVVPAVRLEASVQHRPSFSFDGHANFNQTAGRQDVSADLSSLSGMFATYVNLPSLGLPRLGPFSPFIGVGSGVSHIRIDATRMDFPRTSTIVPGGKRVNITWMLTAGVEAALGDRVMIDLAWRYTDYGIVETGRGKGRIVWRDGSRDPLDLDLAETRADLQSHGLIVSARYMF